MPSVINDPEVLRARRVVLRCADAYVATPRITKADKRDSVAYRTALRIALREFAMTVERVTRRSIK